MDNSVIKVKPNPDCKYCHGEGYVRDRVPYAGGGTTMKSFCDCIEEQVPENFDGTVEIDCSITLKRGTQIVSVPDHVQGKYNNVTLQLEDPAVQFGFVTSGPTNDGSYFCRYWLDKYVNELRTKSCSELTSKKNIVEFNSHSSHEVERAIQEFC